MSAEVRHNRFVAFLTIGVSALALLVSVTTAWLTLLRRAHAQFGNALSLNGVNQHVAVPAAAASAVSTPLTVEAWVYVRSYANWSRLMDFCTTAGVNDIACVLSSNSSGQPSLYFARGRSDLQSGNSMKNHQ